MPVYSYTQTYIGPTIGYGYFKLTDKNGLNDLYLYLDEGYSISVLTYGISANQIISRNFNLFGKASFSRIRANAETTAFVPIEAIIFDNYDYALLLKYKVVNRFWLGTGPGLSIQNNLHDVFSDSFSTKVDFISQKELNFLISLSYSLSNFIASFEFQSLIYSKSNQNNLHAFEPNGCMTLSLSYMFKLPELNIFKKKEECPKF